MSESGEKPIKKIFPNGLEIELVEYYPHLANWYITAEKETQQWLVDHVKEDWNCVEVGAHIGYTSILLSTLCKRVYSFEPNEKSFLMLLANIRHNKKFLNRPLDNIELYLNAVGNQSGDSVETLWLSGMDAKFGETVGVFDFVTLDQVLIDSNRVKDLGLIFIDADGWDFDVLLGSQRCIEKFHPQIILEANYALAWRGHTVADVLNFANLHGYQYQWLDRGCPANMVLY